MTSSLSFSTPTDTHAPQATLVSVAPATLHALSAAIREALAHSSANLSLALQDAGYAGGNAFYTAFHAYVTRHTNHPLSTLGIDAFFQLAGQFFTESGWGTTTFAEHDGAFCLIEISGTWIDEPDDTATQITIGVLSGFLEQFAEYPVSVLELDATHGMTPSRRFLAGPIAAISGYYAKHN